MELADKYVFIYFLEIRYQFVHLNTAALITFSYSFFYCRYPCIYSYLYQKRLDYYN